MVKYSAELDTVFSALADPVRRRMIERLSRGPMTVGEVGAGLSISQPAVSKHVRALEDSGLIKRQIIGRVHRCTLSPDAMRAASNWIEKQHRFWNAALDRLAGILGESPKRKKKK
jgi:DNA-binding transcriptional ArsR family regulator